MTRKAVVQGEFHASPRDAKNLLDRDTSTADAFFVEGRSATIELDGYTHGYVLFLIGYLTLELIYLTSNWLYDLVPGGGWNAKEEASERGLDIKDEIDAELHEIWSLAEGVTRRRLYYLALAVFAYALINPFVGSTVFGIPVGFSSVVLACLIPLGFSAGVIILSLGREGVRDDIMSESILGTADDEEYEEILVLCGQGHVEGIKAELEDAGWDVERHDSTHPLTTVGGWI